MNRMDLIILKDPMREVRNAFALSIGGLDSQV